MQEDDLTQLESEETEISISEPDIRTEAISREEKYFQLLVTALRASIEYKPKFGKGGKDGLTLTQFKQMYGADPFYHWIGLDSPLIALHTN